MPFRACSDQDLTEANGDDACVTACSSARGIVIHFNNAGASPSPPVVVQTITDYLAREVELGGYLAAAWAQPDLDSVYGSVYRLIRGNHAHGDDDDDDGTDTSGIGSDDGRAAASEVHVVGSNNKKARREIALVESATVGWTRIFFSMADCLARRAWREVPPMASSGIETSSHPVVLERIILMSEAEYAANVVAAVKFCRGQNELLGESSRIREIRPRIRWRVLTIPSTTYADDDNQTRSTGMVNTEALENMLSGRWVMNGCSDEEEQRFLDPESIALVCVTHIPTNSGIINPVNDIGLVIAQHNERCAAQAKTRDDSNSRLPRCLYLVDACQSVGQIDLDVRTMRCHALTATGRKYLRGPRGTGFLYVREEVAEALVPSHVDHATAPIATVPTLSAKEINGGGSIDLTDKIDFGYQPGAARFEYWESNIAAKLGLGAAIDYAVKIGMTSIEEKCCRLGAELRVRLRSMDGIEVYHDNVDANGNCLTDQCGIVVFGVEGIDSVHIKQSLLSGGVGTSFCFETSVVPATSTPADSARMVAKDLVRASLSYENTIDQIDSFCKCLERIVQKRQKP